MNTESTGSPAVDAWMAEENRKRRAFCILSSDNRHVFREPDWWMRFWSWVFRSDLLTRGSRCFACGRWIRIEDIER